MLESRDLTFSYDGSTTVLDSLDFTLNPGEIVGILGPTGSGKSTLTKILTGFIPRMIQGEYSGSVTIDGNSIENLSISKVARTVALVQQDPESQICTLNVSDEVAFGPENYMTESNRTDTLVTDSLNAVESYHLRTRSTYALSGGEKQRIIIASMLACEPQYLVLDEPSSSLDPIGVFKLRNVLTELRKRNIGVLCIEHRLPTVLPIADRILRLDNGRLTEWEPKTQTPPVQNRPKVVNRTEKPLISAQNLTFSYGNSPTVNNITISAYPGEIIALMGDNGSGKTTLLSLLGGLLRPDAGIVIVSEDRIEEASVRETAERIGMVFQNPNHQIFERTVWKEQTLGLEIFDQIDEASIEKAEDHLRRAGLGSLRNRNPFSLSHGQKRRLNITSVITHDPLVFLFDEPLIGQDKPGRDLITSVIRERAKTGGSCIVVTHDTSFAVEQCNRLVFMDQGSILLDGTPTKVLDRLGQMGRSEYSEVEVGF